MRQLLPFSIMLAVVFVLADEPGSRYEDLTDVDGNEVARMESEVKQSAQTLDIIPGFSPTGRRTNYTYHEGSDEVECAISYSALGEHTEPWRFTIRRSPWSWACIIESPPGSKLKFSFYSITFSGGGRWLCTHASMCKCVCVGGCVRVRACITCRNASPA